MNTVKYSAKTTATLIVFALGLVALTKWCNTIPHEAIYYIRRTLNSRFMLEPTFRTVQSISFWSLLIVSVEYAVINNCFGFKVFQAFAIPLTISVIATIATLISEIPFHWYWAGYFVLLIFGVKSSFTKLSSINKSNSKLVSFASELRNKPSIEGDPIDFYVVYLTKALLLPLFVALVLSLIIFCMIHKHSFGIN